MNGYEMGILKVAPEAYFEVRSLTSLSYDRSIASSKMSSPYSAIYCSLLQIHISYFYLNFIQ
jgi:hypothetical protein